jgi:hypothetical protein
MDDPATFNLSDLWDMRKLATEAVVVTLEPERVTSPQHVRSAYEDRSETSGDLGLRPETLVDDIDGLIPLDGRPFPPPDADDPVNNAMLLTTASPTAKYKKKPDRQNLVVLLRIPCMPLFEGKRIVPNGCESAGEHRERGHFLCTGPNTCRGISSHLPKIWSASFMITVYDFEGS